VAVFVADALVAAVVVAADVAGVVVVAAVVGDVDGADEGSVSTLVAELLELVPGVHPATAATIATAEITAASPRRLPDPVPMAGRYSRRGALLRRWTVRDEIRRAGFEKPSNGLRASVSDMDLTLARCFITVTDPDKALAFYRDVLGLDVVMDVAGGDFRWITVGSKTQPGVQIVLSNYIQGSPDDQSYMAGLVAKGALNAVHFHTDDLDGVFATLAEAGAEIVSEPTTQPWGTRDGAVRDPSGNLVRIEA
jgi:uncharacterized glyoxalase superfamily protein PhnB